MKVFVALALLICVPIRVYAADCADGYSVVDSSGLCKAYCGPGYWIETPGEACKKVKTGTSAPAHYVDTAHYVAYGDVTPDSIYKQCPHPGTDKVYLDGPFISPTIELANNVNLCYVTVSKLRFQASDKGGTCPTNDSGGRATCPTHGTIQANCYYESGADGSAVYGNNSVYRCVGNSYLETCDAGFYASVRVAGMPQDHPCDPVGTGYYSPAGDLDRYPCPANTASCGYGDCAASASDCVAYKTLNVGGNISIVMSQAYRSSPSLAVRGDDGVVWYAQTAPGTKSGFLSLSYGGNTWRVINPLERFYVLETKYGSFYNVPED